MNATTIALLSLADTMPGGREAVLEDVAPLIVDKKYFSSEAVAQRYDVSLSCVKAWRTKGLITPSLKIPGGTARYTLADLIEFETKQREKRK